MTETKKTAERLLDEVLPQIRAELGDDAIILRRREGIVGGIGGFFGRRCVEVDASPARARTECRDSRERRLRRLRRL